MDSGTEDFAKALSNQMKGRSREELAVEVKRRTGEGVTVSAVAQWMAGTTEPTRAKVWAIEEYLRLKPGALSKLLGYLPVGARAVTSVTEAVNADPKLTEQARRALLAAYREFTR